MKFRIKFWNTDPVEIILPQVAQYEVKFCDYGKTMERSNPGTKPVTLMNGLVVQVPKYVSEGDIVSLDTCSGEFIRTQRNET